MKNNKIGRPPKKDYDPTLLMQELINTVVEIYNTTQEIKATAIELSLPPNKVKKLLITAKVLTYPETEQIQALQAQQIPMEEIQRIMSLSYSAINTYLPYTKVIYKMSEVSRNGEYTRELFIDRRENSKSLAWSSIRLAFQNTEPGKVYQRPKAVGDIRGISYSYSLLWWFGVIRVPEAVEKKLKGK